MTTISQPSQVEMIEAPARPAAEPRAEAYRPDIDGLRALAIIPVVLYHAGFSALSGGFVGVDVFFVISGFLIGGIIYRECTQSRFSVLGFYARRARRILPALFTVMAFCYLAAAVLLTPAETREFSKSAVATLLGASNLLLYGDSGYFSPAAETNPLLMTWSLGVEEQFYLFFPLVMIAALRLAGRRAGVVVGVLSLVSFAGSIILTKLDPKAAFYLLPTRAWELGIGATLAMAESSPAGRPAFERKSQWLSIGGGVLVLAAIVCYRPAIPFPGLYALAPVLGAAMIIAAPGGWTNRLLSQPATTFVGKVSYSFYLWHWPLLCLARVLLGRSPSLALSSAIVAASFTLAVLSWWFVERSFRRRSLANGAVLARYGAALMALIAIGGAAYLTRGFPARYSPALQRVTRDINETQANPCLAAFGETTFHAACLGKGTGPALVLFGDSHANAIAPGVRQVALAKGLDFRQLTKSSCAPLSGFSDADPDRPHHAVQCVAFQKAALDYVRSHPEVKVVALAGYWSNYTEVPPLGRPRAPDLEEALDKVLTPLLAAGRRVILIQDVPTFAVDPYPEVAGNMIPARVAVAGLLGKPAPPASAAQRAPAAADAARAVLSAAAARHPGVILFDPYRSMCEAGRCAYAGPDGIYYRDFQHLSASGARRAVGGLAEAL